MRLSLGLRRLFGKASRAKVDTSRRSNWLKPRRARAGMVENLESRQLLTMNVAVVGTGLGGGADSGFTYIRNQLNDSTTFDFNATLVAPTDVDTLAELQAYDTVVIGDSGNNQVDFGAFESVLRSYVEGGGGVVGAGWLIYGAGNYTPPAHADIDAIIPVNTIDFDDEIQGTDITPNLTVHPVTAGVSAFNVSGAGGYVSIPRADTQPRVDPGATVLATSFDTNSGTNEASVVVGDVGLGRSVYLGPIYAANSNIYSDANLRSGDGDRLLEQAVAWSVRPATSYVDDSWSMLALGSDPDGIGPATALGFDAFSTIQEAVDATKVGGSVLVNAGNYAEQVSITKDLTLDGISGVAADVVIDTAPAPGGRLLINAPATTVTVSDLTVTGANTGLHATSITDLTITNVVATGNVDHGIVVSGAANVTITDSDASDNFTSGITLGNISGTTKIKNTKATSIVNEGLLIVNSGPVILDGGTFTSIELSGVTSAEVQNNKVTAQRYFLVYAADEVALNASVDAGAAVGINANSDGAGAESFVMAAGTSITTTDDSEFAVSIFVNTLIGGTGDAKIAGITAGTTAGPTGGRVTIGVVGGGIIDNNAASTNITAGNAVLTGTAGIGLGNSIETQVSNLEAAGSAGVFIDNSGALTVGGISMMVGVSSSAGQVSLTTHSPLTVSENISADTNVELTATETVGSTDNITVEAGVTITSSKNDIELCAGDNVSLEETSVLNAPQGSVVIEIDCMNADAAGGVATIAGTINSLNGATVTGDSNDDQFYVSNMGTGGLELDGLNGNDLYQITYPSVATFGSDITIAESGTGTDQVIVEGTSDADEIFITTEDPPTNATTEEVSRGSLGSEKIIIPDTVESLLVRTFEGSDLIHAQPSMLFPITIDAGEPCVEDLIPPDLGDVLDFEPFGNEASFDPYTSTISTAGGNPDPYFGVTILNFENVEFNPLGTGGLQQFDFDYYNTAASVMTSPTQAGYTSVLPNTLYSGGLGYGWQTAVQGFERNDGFYGNAFADLVRDGHSFGTSATFTADVPTSGYYYVSVMYGSPYSDINGMSVKNGDSGTTLAAGLTSLAGASVHREFLVYVPDTSLDLTFVNSSIAPKIFAVNGIAIRPADIMTIGICPPGPFTADGVTVDSFPIAGATPNTLITVSTSAGTIMNPDVDDELAGIQILTDGAGEATLLVRRPFNDVTAIVTFAAVDGSLDGLGYLQYVLPDGRKFDFNHKNASSSATPSPTQAPVASGMNPDGFVGVLPSMLYGSTTSFGWLQSPYSFDQGIKTDSSGTPIPDPDPLYDLHRDGAHDLTPRTFRVELPNGDYQATVTLGWDQDIDQVSILVNGATKASGIAVNAGDNEEVTFMFSVVNGIADFTFTDLGGNSPFWAVNGIEIDSVSAVSPITFTPNIGNVPADGMTVVTVNATSGMAMGQQVTVSTTVGTVVSADVNPSVDGVQVLVGPGGAIAFDVQSPTQSGTPTLRAVSLDGTHDGSITSAAFLSFGLADARRFDFNHPFALGGFGQSPTAAGAIGVLRTDTSPLVDGYGWVTSPNSGDVGVPNVYDQGGSNTYNKLTTDLYRDYASGAIVLGARTFQVQVAAATDYDVRVYVGAQDMDQAVTVTVEGVAGSLSLATNAKEFGTLLFTAADDANNDGLLSITFISAGGISPYWAVNGVDIAETSGSLPVEAPLVTSTPGTGDGVGPLTSTDLAPVQAFALTAWASTGLTQNELDLLAQTQIIIRDLGNTNGALGMVDGLGRIIIDDDGAGQGWSTDLAMPASNRFDLATVLAHEYGHILGRHDLDPQVYGDDLMSALLGLGERHDVVDGASGFFN